MSWRTLRSALAIGLLAVGLHASAGGCLVTERVDYSAPNIPPIVDRVRPDQISQLLMNDPECDPDKVGFIARVTDFDVNDELEAKIVIWGQDTTFAKNIPITTDRRPDRGLVSFCVDRSLFVQPCSRVELLVSTDFDTVNRPYGTDIPGDLGRTDWMVKGSAIDGSADAVIADCLPILVIDAGAGDAAVSVDAGP